MRVGTLELARTTVSLLLIFALAGSCANRPERMSRSDAGICRAEGGFESRGPFGAPLCQFRYSDGGRRCSDKSECQGECLLILDGAIGPVPKAGDAAKGKCEAAKSTFGCYAVIEQGRIDSDGAVCFD